MSDARKPSRVRRWFAGGASVIGVVMLLVAGVAFWLLATSSGAQFAIGRAMMHVGGSVGTVEGQLVGPLAIDAIAIESTAFRLRATRVVLDWSPLGLLGGELRIGRLHAASLEIATVPSQDPLREPDTLVLPIRFTVDGATVDRLLVGRLGDAGEGTELRDVAIRLAIDGNAWILGGAQASTPVGRATLAGTLGAKAPFPLALKGELAGTRGGADYRAGVVASGTLAAIAASLDAREGGLSGTASATLEPFSAVPLRRLAGKLEGLDLSAFAAAPRTRLTVEADLGPHPGAILAGSVKFANAEPMPLDKGGLPVVSGVAQLAIAEGRIEATRLAVAFTGTGSASGEARWADGKLDAKVNVKDIDLRGWHSALRATKLSGNVAAVATGEAQSFDVALVDPRFEIRGDARIADGKLTIGKARLSRGAAFAEASGTLALAGNRDFRAEGRIERLDPAAFSTLPPGELNVGFTATGSLAKGPAGEAVLEIAKSRLAGLAFDGRVTLAGDGASLSRAEADVSLGATRLATKGSLGRADDSLAVKLTSPDLAPIGRAFGHTVGGSVDLDARVSGTFSALSGDATVSAKDLALPGDLRVALVSGRLELGAGDAGAANGQMTVQGIAKRGEKTTLVESASVLLKGTRRSHEIRLTADFADKSSVQALLDGGVMPGARLPEWRGRLESLSTAGLAEFALVAPTSLVVSAERIELGEAIFSGEPGDVRLAVARWTPAGLELRGSSKALVLRSIRQILNLQGEMGSSLVLASEWDLRVGESVDGFVSIRRERGDVRVGEPRQALGLEALDLRIDAIRGRIRATADIRGKQVGQWKGEAAATVAHGDDGWVVSPLAPIEGRFTVDVPDVAWTAAWIGPEAKAGGRLSGEGTLAGTLRDPTWRGRIDATGIVIREPSSGAEVEDGTIAIVLKDREARIERFVLSMPWRPTADAAQAIGNTKRPVPGTLTAEGGLDLGTRKGTVRVKADGWPLSRLATRFLAISGEGRAELDGATTAMTGDFVVDAAWFGIPGAAPPSLSDDVIIVRGEVPPAVNRDTERIRLDLRVNLGEHTHFAGRGLVTRLAGSLRLTGDLGANLRTTGTIRAIGGTYEAYGRTLALERGALNFQGPIDNPGLNVLALRKGLPVEAGVEILGTLARPKARLVSTPDVPDSEKLAWLVLGRGKGDVTAADAASLVGAASSLLGQGAPSASKVFRGLGIDEVSLGADESGVLGTMPQSTVAGRTGSTSAAEVVTVGKQLSENIRVSYRQGLADAEGSFRITLQVTKSLQLILRAGYQPGLDAAWRFTFN